MNDFITTDIDINDINDDDFYKVSKKNYNETLSFSLKTSGMLEIPYVLKTDSGYNIFTCHNRIKILKESGIKYLKCHILNAPDPVTFMNNVSLKVYRNEIGPMSKLKVLSQLRKHFNVPEEVIKDFSLKVLKIPDEIAGYETIIENVLSFPYALAGYIDARDVSLKIIKDLSILPVEWIAVMDGWVNEISVRINLFKMISDYMFDIYRRGDKIEVIKKVIFTDDKTLHNALFNIRYPEYSALKKRSESIIGELNNQGISIDFPEFFDRGYLTIKLDINKKSSVTNQLKKIALLDADKINELISFL